jgi:hypothetical protein
VSGTLLGLTLVTLIPTGGGSAAAALALTGLAYDVYAGLGEYEDFKFGSAAADTDLDKMRSLSDAEPSLTPLLMRMVSAGLNATAAGGLFKRAAALRRAAMAGSVEAEAVAALNRAGEAAGVEGIGDEAVANARSGATAAKPAHGEKPTAPSADAAEHPQGHAARDEAGGQRGHGSTAKAAASDARARHGRAAAGDDAPPERARADRRDGGAPRRHRAPLRPRGAREHPAVGVSDTVRRRVT